MGGCSAEGIGTEDRMKTKDNGRKWMWRFLGVLVALQLYFVRELLAAFALFALAFAAIAFVIVSLYMLQKSWEVAVGRVAGSHHAAWDVGGGRPGAATAAAAGFRDGEDNLTASG